MQMGIRFVAELYDIQNGNVIESKILRADTIKCPTTLKEFGYLHDEQIQLLHTIQDFKLHYETKLINEEAVCPECGRKTSPRGTRQSNFHAVFTDHKINIQSRRCQCGWRSADSVDSIYGSSLHPDLIEKQVIQGSENSYRQASRQLNAESKITRSINNDDRIRRNIGADGNYYSERKIERTYACKK